MTAVQWSMNYVDALHLPEFQVAILFTLFIEELLLQPEWGASWITTFSYQADGAQMCTSAMSRSTLNTSTMYHATFSFPPPHLKLAHPPLLEPLWGPPEPRPPPGPHSGHLGAWEWVGTQVSWAGLTLASRPATLAWAFMTEVGGGAGREGRREGRREGGEGEENGKGKRGTGRR